MSPKRPPIPRRIVPSARCAAIGARTVAREFVALLDEGAIFQVDGRAKRDPRSLLARGCAPRHRVDLFDARIYFSNLRQIPELRFYVAYVLPDHALRVASGRRPRIYARIFYKDLSLVWRVASHMNRDRDGALWIGKGDIEVVDDGGGYERIESIESTTDLPLELQDALEDRVRVLKRVPVDEDVLELVLRRSPPHRIEPYADFTRPRERAAADPRNLIHRGRSVARFRKAGDPNSLEFVSGYEPDFERGVLESSETRSRLYAGRVRRYRILSRNRRIQYLFLASSSHVWIVPPQATTTELSSYGVRTIDVVTHPDLCVPGWEYHYLDSDLDPPSVYSQIPEGYAGGPCPMDEHKADASPWLDRLPVVRAFRSKVLGEQP